MSAMPTFDFKCTKCDHTFEETIAFGSKKYPPCPSCSAKQVQKLVSSPAGIVFKGSGFYHTDSRKDPPKPKEADTVKTADKGNKSASSASTDTGTP